MPVSRQIHFQSGSDPVTLVVPILRGRGYPDRRSHSRYSRLDQPAGLDRLAVVCSVEIVEICT